LQLARLALIVAAPGRCGGPREQLGRRRHRGPEGPRAARGVRRHLPPGDPPCERLELRRVRAGAIFARRLASGIRRAWRALEVVQKVCTDPGLRSGVCVSLSVFPVLASGATPPGKRLRPGAVPGGGLAAYGPAPPPARAPQDPFQPLRGKHLEAPPLRAEPLRTLRQESRAGGSLPQPTRGPHLPPWPAGWHARAKRRACGMTDPPDHCRA
jgi:hypothetical protein